MSKDLRLDNNRILNNNNDVINNNVTSNRLSFKGNPNAVDTTPQSDTYQQVPPMPKDIPNVPGKVACIVPTAAGIYGISKLFDKACGGEYEKSLLGRLGKLGDKIAGSKVFNNRITDKIKIYSSGIKKNIQSFIDKHPALSAFQKTPTEPENRMVKGFVESTSTVELTEASGKIAEFIEKTPKTLKEAGATKEEIQALKKEFGTNIFGKIKNEKAAVHQFQMQKFVSPERLKTIANREIALMKQAEKFQNILAALPENDPRRFFCVKRLNDISELQRTYRPLELQRAKMSKLGLNIKTFGEIKTNPTANASAIEHALEGAVPHSKKLSQILNKLKSARKPVTKLGRFLPKAAKVAMRGLTFGGGLFNSALVAIFMATGLQSLAAAPKKQKVGTGVNALLDAMDWIVTLPIAITAMHRVAGLKNIGLSKNDVKAYKDALKVFNADVKAGKLTNKIAYNRRLVELNRLKTPGKALTKGQKILQKFGKFIGVSLEKVAPYQAATEGLKGAAKNKAVWGNFARRMPNFLRSCVGYPLRFGLYMFAFQPLVDKLFRGVTSLIFGKPYNIEEEKEMNEKIIQERAALYSGPRALPFEGAKQDLDKVRVTDLSDNNLVKQKVTGVRPAEVQAVNNNPNNTQQYPAQMQNGNPTYYTDYSEPFMPPNWVNNQNNNQNNFSNNNQIDINKSQYDTVERHYVPQLDLSQPLKYSDPMDDPNNPHNRKACIDLIDKSQKFARKLENSD